MKQRVFPVVITQDGGDGGLVIQASDTESVNGWNVPSLTSEQVLSAYNSLVAGKPVVVESSDGDIQFNALIGDATTDNPYILIQYYWLGWVEYQVSSNTKANIVVHKLPEHYISSVNVGVDTIDITIV